MTWPCTIAPFPLYTVDTAACVVLKVGQHSRGMAVGPTHSAIFHTNKKFKTRHIVAMATILDPISSWYFIYHFRQLWGPVSHEIGVATCFFYHFRPTLGACISRSMGRMSVPMADMALSDVIQQIWTFESFSIFWPFLVNFQGPDFSSDCTYGFADPSCMTSWPSVFGIMGLWRSIFKKQTNEYMGDLGLTFQGHFRSSGMFSNWSSYMCSNKRQYITSYTSLIVINSVSGLVSKIQAIYHM